MARSDEDWRVRETAVRALVEMSPKGEDTPHEVRRRRWGGGERREEGGREKEGGGEEGGGRRRGRREEERKEEGGRISQNPALGHRHPV
eukprot:767080-Hanusia_phi.AAC.2